MEPRIQHSGDSQLYVSEENAFFAGKDGKEVTFFWGRRKYYGLSLPPGDTTSSWKDVVLGNLRKYYSQIPFFSMKGGGKQSYVQS